MAQLYNKMTQAERDEIIRVQKVVGDRQKQQNDPNEVKKMGNISKEELRHVGDNILGLKGQYEVKDNIGLFSTVTNSPDIVYVR